MKILMYVSDAAYVLSHPTKGAIAVNEQGSIIAVIATAFPALRTLALSELDGASRLQGEQLHPLSQLTGLRGLYLAIPHGFDPFSLDIMSSLWQLESLELGIKGYQFSDVFAHLSSLGSLPHLTHLAVSCPSTKGSMGGVDGLRYPEAVEGLLACKQLTSLHIPRTNLTEGAAESLAAGLPHLTRLSVSQIGPTAPMEAPCSWKELTMHGRGLQCFEDLVKLPLAGIDTLHLDYLELATHSDDRSVEDHIHTLELYAPLVASKLRALPKLTLDCSGHPMDSAQLTRLLTSIVTLGGSMLTDLVITGLPASILLQRSHMELLAAGLPRLTQLSLLHKSMLHRNLDLSAWPCLGTMGLHTLTLGDHYSLGIALKPQYMGLLASSVKRPLRLVLRPCDVEAARTGLETLLAGAPASSR